MFSNWIKFVWDANLLALESQRVIAMRLMRISLGGKRGSKETRRMLSEKVLAASQAGLKVATGGSGHSVVKQYRRKVRANLRRLAK